MHELGLAHSIGEIALKALREQEDAAGGSDGNPLRVGRVWVAVGDLSGVDPEALAFCFEVVRGEWVETAGSALTVERRPARVVCPACGAGCEFSIDDLEDDAGCAQCHEAGRRIEGGRELEVFRVELIGASG